MFNSHAINKTLWTAFCIHFYSHTRSLLIYVLLMLLYMKNGLVKLEDILCGWLCYFILHNLLLKMFRNVLSKRKQENSLSTTWKNN